MEFETFYLKNEEYSQIRSFDDSNTQYKKYSEDSNEQTQQICHFQPIYKQPNQQRRFILIGDTYICLNKNDDQNFIELLRLQNALRPVSHIEKNAEQKFMRIKIDQSSQGLTDFRFLIKIMESMQDQQMYTMSQYLSFYQNLIGQENQRKQSFDQDSLFQRFQIFQHHQDVILPQILQQEAINNPFQIQGYEIFNCINGSIDCRKSEIGFNENYVHFIGSDFQTLQAFIMREGWFDQSQIFSSNHVQNIFFEKIISELLQQGEVNGKIEPFDHTIVTVDQIKIPVKVNLVIHYFFCDSTSSKNLTIDRVDDVISFVCFYNLDIEPKQIKRLMNIRKQKNTISLNNLIYQSLDNTLSQFSYEIQADYFYNKFYNIPQEQKPKEPQLNELYPEKTCKFREI